MSKQVANDRFAWVVLAFGLGMYAGLGLVLFAFCVK